MKSLFFKIGAACLIIFTLYGSLGASAGDGAVNATQSYKSNLDARIDAATE